MCFLENEQHACLKRIINYLTTFFREIAKTFSKLCSNAIDESQYKENTCNVSYIYRIELERNIHIFSALADQV